MICWLKINWTVKRLTEEKKKKKDTCSILCLPIFHFNLKYQPLMWWGALCKAKLTDIRSKTHPCNLKKAGRTRRVGISRLPFLGKSLAQKWSAQISSEARERTAPPLIISSGQKRGLLIEYPRIVLTPANFTKEWIIKCNCYQKSLYSPSWDNRREIPNLLCPVSTILVP